MEEIFEFEIGDRVKIKSRTEICKITRFNLNIHGLKLLLKDEKTGIEFGPIEVANIELIEKVKDK